MNTPLIGTDSFGPGVAKGFHWKGALVNASSARHSTQVLVSNLNHSCTIHHRLPSSTVSWHLSVHHVTTMGLQAEGSLETEPVPHMYMSLAHTLVTAESEQKPHELHTRTSCDMSGPNVTSWSHNLDCQHWQPSPDDVQVAVEH